MGLAYLAHPLFVYVGTKTRPTGSTGIVMKTLKNTMFVAALLAGLVSTSPQAAPVVGWVSIYDAQNTIPRFVGSTASTASPVTTDADQDSIAANFPAVALADGEFITLSGSVTFDVNLAADQFRIGLFDGPVATQDAGGGYAGFYTGAPTASSSGVKHGNGSSSTHPFETGAGTSLGSMPPAGAGVAAGTPLAFVLTLTRDGSDIDLFADYSASGYSSSTTLQNVNVSGMGYAFDSVVFLLGGGLNGNQASFANIAVTNGVGVPPEPDPVYGPRVLGIDFNRNDAFGSPSQSLFRIVSGSTTQGSNSASYAKTIGTNLVTVSQPGSVALEFRGANTDGSRAIPGGDISISFLVSDFLATREGALDIGISNLPAGDYVFRSFHLDTYTGADLGFAQGSSSTTPNTIEARIGGILKDSVQPTALGSAGLNTTFINDSQVPSLVFPFTHDGSSPLVIALSSTETNGGNSYLLLNGFELLEPTP